MLTSPMARPSAATDTACCARSSVVRTGGAPASVRLTLNSGQYLRSLKRRHECTELSRDVSRQVVRIAFAKQVVARAVDLDEHMGTGNQLQCSLHLFDGTERVARAVDEQRRLRQLREMTRAELRRL